MSILITIALLVAFSASMGYILSKEERQERLQQEAESRILNRLRRSY